MQKYIALLRGINIGGHKIIPMAQLKELFVELGFSNVVTYIQSGNVLFKAKPQSLEKMKAQIERGIENKFGFSSTLFVFEAETLARVLEENPFRDRKLKEGEKIYFTLFSDEPGPAEVGKLKTFPNYADEFEIIGKTLYVLCKKGYSQTLFTTNFVEKNLKVHGTSRNLETMTKLVKMAAELPD